VAVRKTSRLNLDGEQDSPLASLGSFLAILAGASNRFDPAQRFQVDQQLIHPVLPTLSQGRPMNLIGAAFDGGDWN
jgi:hypothetical protein